MQLMERAVNSTFFDKGIKLKVVPVKEEHCYNCHYLDKMHDCKKNWNGGVCHKNSRTDNKYVIFKRSK